MEQPEALLAHHEAFADWRSITNRTLTFYCRCVELLAQHSVVAREWLDSFDQTTDERRYRVLTDPLVRVSINDAMTSLKRQSFESFGEVEIVLEATLSHLREDFELAPLATAVASETCCVLGPNAAPVWSGSCTSGAVGPLMSARFQSLFDQEIATAMSDQHVALVSPSEAQAEILRQGERLLLRLLPEVSRNVLRFVHLAAVADVREKGDQTETHKYLSASASSNRIPGTVFLTPRALSSPVDAAEALLHEACHKLLHDLILTRPILRSGYSPNVSPTITAVWNQSFPWNPNRWPIDRAVLAAHVYVHLALFFKRVCEAGVDAARAQNLPGTSTPDVWRRVSYDRARYLLRHLAASAGDELGQFGFALLDWLRLSLISIDASSPEDEILAA